MNESKKITAEQKLQELIGKKDATLSDVLAAIGKAEEGYRYFFDCSLNVLCKRRICKDSLLVFDWDLSENLLRDQSEEVLEKVFEILK